MARFKVSGMTCEGCVNSVKRAITRVSSGASVSVDLAQGIVDVGGEVEPAQIAGAIAGAGFTVDAQLP